MKQFLAILLLVSLALAHDHSPQSSEDKHEDETPILITYTGRIRGHVVKIHPKFEVYEFTNIPYAEPPVGHRRFERARPKRRWNGIFNANKPERACPQNFQPGRDDIDLNSDLEKIHQSEDCLVLSIWVPKKFLDKYLYHRKVEEQWPVLVFFHRGGYSGGQVTPYDGSNLAGINDIIVVTVQYRIGILGYAFHHHVHSNNGLWDQVEALRWIHANIHSFGGNKHRVTIAGSGPAALEVGLHLISHHSRHYFQGAILQSVVSLKSFDVHLPHEAANLTRTVFDAVISRACPLVNANAHARMRCLKHVPVQLFVKAEKYYDLTTHKLANIPPVYDDNFLRREIFNQLRKGLFHRVPVMIGFSRDEGSSFAAYVGDVKDLLPTRNDRSKTVEYTDRTDFEEMIDAFPKWWWSGIPKKMSAMEAIKHRYWPDAADNVYPDGLSVAQAVSDVMTDSSIICPIQRWANFIGHFEDSTYAYYFSHRREGSIAPEWMGVTHGSELPFVFGEPMSGLADKLNYTYDDTLVTRVVMGYWANFVRYGTPNGHHEYDRIVPHSSSKRQLQHWPSYRNKDCRESIMELSLDTSVDKNREGFICRFKEHDCHFWERFVSRKMAKLD